MTMIGYLKSCWLQLDRARETLITGFFDMYLQLNEQEEQQFKEEVKAMKPKEGEKIMEIMNSYERKGREIGVEEGMEKGREEAILSVARRMLNKGKTVEEVADLTGLSEEIVAKL